MKQQLRIEGIPMALNQYRNAHYFQINKEKDKWQKVVALEVINQKIVQIGKCRISIDFFFRDKRRHDPDNYACSAKYLLDGLVKAGIIADDNFDVIESLSIRQGGISKQPYLMITLESVQVD
jgi:crossover junction endodeoxyribonuclease RusA